MQSYSGSSDRLESISEAFIVIWKRLDSAESKFKTCTAKLEDINTVHNKFAEELNLIPMS